MARNTEIGNSLPNTVIRGMRVFSGNGSLTWLRLPRPSDGASSSDSWRNPSPMRLAATLPSRSVVSTSGTLRQ